MSKSVPSCGVLVDTLHSLDTCYGPVSKVCKAYRLDSNEMQKCFVVARWYRYVVGVLCNIQQ